MWWTQWKAKIRNHLQWQNLYILITLNSYYIHKHYLVLIHCRRWIHCFSVIKNLLQTPSLSYYYQQTTVYVTVDCLCNKYLHVMTKVFIYGAFRMTTWACAPIKGESESSTQVGYFHFTITVIRQIKKDKFRSWGQ